MKKKTFESKLNDILKELQEISHIGFYLYSADGNRIAGTDSDENEGIMEAVHTFADSAAESQIAYGCHFQKINIQKKTEYILLSDMNRADDYSFVIAQLAASEIRNLHEMAFRQEDEKQVFRRFLLGEIDADEYWRSSRRAGKIDSSAKRLFVVDFDGERPEVAEAILRNFCTSGKDDCLLDMDETHTLLIKNAEKPNEEECHSFADMIIDNLQSEAMVKARVGYGNPATQISQMPKSYREACTALTICSIFYPELSVAVCGHLGIGQLIYQLPQDLCENFLHEVFPKNQQEQMDDEMLATVDRLFENNLNISETARQMYIHRNTLVYRLERIQRIIGLDLRVFDDAMMFRIAMMVKSHVDYMKREKEPEE